jgi:glutathione S-transferase
MKMTESAAICHYLVTRYGPSQLAVMPDEPDYGAYLNFLFMGEATLTFPQTVYLRYTFLEPAERKLPQAAADYTQWFASRFKAAVTMMGREYVCANRFTAADISLAYAIKLANAIGLADAVPAVAQEYWQRLQSRPALQRAEARDGKLRLREDA